MEAHLVSQCFRRSSVMPLLKVMLNHLYVAIMIVAVAGWRTVNFTVC